MITKKSERQNSFLPVYEEDLQKIFKDEGYLRFLISFLTAIVMRMVPVTNR